MFSPIYSRFLFSALILLLPDAIYAQKGKVVSAVEQCWSGGMRGRHGCNYSFDIEIKVPNSNRNKLQPDTLWIGDYPVALVAKNSTPENDGNMAVSRGKYGVKFDINAATVFDDEEERMPHRQQEQTPPLAKPPKKYKGVALLSYKYMGKRNFYEIARFTEQKPHISYP